MKVKLAAWIKSMSGRLDDLVFCVDKKTGNVWVRDYVVPERTEQNTRMGLSAKNMAVFRQNINEEYYSDLEDYSDRYNLQSLGQSGRLNGYSVLNKMLYALKRAYPTIDLTTITPQFVVDHNLPIRTVAEAIEHGFLPPVPRYDEFVNPIML